MSRRIEVELTSTREDGTWTWRAAGAKLPKGELNGSLLFAGAKVGDVVRADAEFLLDGIEILSVLPPKGARKEPERIELLGRPVRDDELVTSKLAPKGRGDRGDRRERRDRRPRDGEDRGDRGERRGGERGDRRPRREGESQDARRKQGDRAHTPRPTKPAPERPKAKRLRAGRAHRNAVLTSLPPEQKPVAEQVLRGGIPAVRQALEKQNEERRAAGEAPVPTDAILKMAEDLTPALRAAEWRDKAEAAVSDLDELDLRDLRSVVVAADAGARDDESRALAETLRSGLTARVEKEQAAWLAEIDELLDGGRAVRALRVSSRPPKAGAPLPADLASRLSAAAAESLTAETGQDRYATVLDALAHSPVRAQVTPQGVPAEPNAELVAAVTKLASRLPQIATMFGIEASTAPRTRKPRPPKPATASPAPTEAPTGVDEAPPAAEEGPADEDAATEDAATEVAAPVAELVEVAEPETTPTESVDDVGSAAPVVDDSTQDD